MQIPQRTKFRKQHKGRIHGLAWRGSSLSFGDYALKATTPGRVTSRQIEAARRAIQRYLRRSGKLYIRVFTDVPVSSKPAEVRMGKGKGSPEYWVVRIKPGRILFELEGVSEEMARGAFARAKEKLPIDTKFVARLGMEAA